MEGHVEGREGEDYETGQRHAEKKKHELSIPQPKASVLSTASSHLALFYGCSAIAFGGG
ncbi:MAG: hypothetical protein QXO49_02350 [Candidatus Bathyarchaeia archaeon]